MTKYYGTTEISSGTSWLKIFGTEEFENRAEAMEWFNTVRPSLEDFRFAAGIDQQSVNFRYRAIESFEGAYDSEENTDTLKEKTYSARISLDISEPSTNDSIALLARAWCGAQ